jgi:hypothetical protein
VQVYWAKPKGWRRVSSSDALSSKKPTTAKANATSSRYAAAAALSGALIVLLALLARSGTVSCAAVKAAEPVGSYFADHAETSE